jgi:hypothetical protein
MPVSSKWSPSLRFPAKSLYAPLLSLIRATCSAKSHYSSFHHSNNIWWRVQSTKLPYHCATLLNVYP